MVEVEEAVVVDVAQADRAPGHAELRRAAGVAGVVDVAPLEVQQEGQGDVEGGLAHGPPKWREPRTEGFRLSIRALVRLWGPALSRARVTPRATRAKVRNGGYAYGCGGVKRRPSRSWRTAGMRGTSFQGALGSGGSRLSDCGLRESIAALTPLRR